VKLLIEEGVDFTKKTRGGYWALDAEVLESIDHPLAQIVLQRRRVQKISSTYLSNFISMQDDEHVIRPSMDTLGAATGRMSMELLQTLPRRSDKNPLASIVRNCIVPRPGNVLFMCDWDQIEFRVLAHLAKDPGLIDAFNRGDDFFLNIAQETFAEPEMKRADERRQMIKNAMYSKAYGAGVAKFSSTAGIPLELGTQVMAQLDAKYPGIKSLQRQVDKVAHERVRIEGRPYVLSPLTGKHFYLKDDDKIYALVNYMIQGTAAEVLKMKAVEMNRAGIGQYLTLFVHDEVIGDVPLDQAREVSDTVSQIMNDDQIFAPVPVTATLGLGNRWGEKGDVKMEDLP
jgi:DNA polymerase-1